MDFMKTVDFFGNKVSRLIVGGNPFSGFSYITDKISRDNMLDYYTADKIIQTLKYAETLGYTAFIATTDCFTARWYRQYTNEGGTLKWIAQTHVPLDMNVCVNIAVEGKAIAIFHQGTHGDSLFESSDLEQYRKNIDIMRNAGIPVGLATHVPEFVKIAEEKLDLNFYMTCLHNMRRDNEGRVSSSISGLKNEPHTFVFEDREPMFNVIKSLDKPCIAFKFLAGGNYAFDRDGLKKCFIETFGNIKPNDLAAVGMFQRDYDQLKENALLLDEIL